jgi:hypothetical protein
MSSPPRTSKLMPSVEEYASGHFDAVQMDVAAVLIGFTAARSGPGLDIVLYCAAATLVFALALLAWRAWRRNREPLGRGLRVPARPAAALLLAAAVVLIWLGLPFGAGFP